MTVRCTFADGAACEVRPGETLLQACRRSAILVPFSCGAGICHTCLLQAVEGTVPPEAQEGLPQPLRELNYLLACRCSPLEPLRLAPPAPAHLVVDALLHDVQASGPFLHVALETFRAVPCASGDEMRLALPQGVELALQVTRCDEAACLLEGLVPADGPAAGELAQATFGTELRVRGPVPASEADDAELEAPATDPALWQELGAARVRRILEVFYGRVYADPRLAPFFDKITIARSIDKQYSFLRQLMTGERVYFGDRPRNAHHWMVISGELFDHRQAVMEQVLREEGLTAVQVARWTRLELHWRRDIVKAQAWPRVVDGIAVSLDGYGRETLAEATVCDHCGQGIDAGVTVDYHLRLGTVSCPGCGAEARVGNA